MKNSLHNSAIASTEEFAFGAKEYGEVLDSLWEAIGEENYFSGKIHTDHEGFCSTLTLSAIIYRDINQPERPICNIVPIWWEMATFDSNNNEHLNNFSFKELLSRKK